MIPRRQFLTQFGAVAAAPALLRGAPRQPNFVLLLADDMGYGDLGVNGPPSIRTPNLDRMAAEGTKLTSFYSASSVCTPSRTALLTGRYPIRSGMVRVLFPDEPFGISDDEITLGQALKRQGYATACIGKWHLGDRPPYRPNKHGFDYYFGLRYSNDMDPSFHKRPMPYPLTLYRNEEAVETPATQPTLTQRYTAEAIQFINRNRNNPFFLYVPYNMPHQPWFSSDQFKDKSPRGTYGDAVEELDWSAGEILRALRQAGLEDNTLLIFTSDNGAAGMRGAGSNAPFRGFKFSTWEGGFREPLVARWPGRIPAGSVQTQMASMMDLFTTFVEMSGGKAPSDRAMDGLNILPFLEGRAASPRQDYYFFDSPWDSRTRLCAARVGPWKLHFKEGSGPDRMSFEPQALYQVEHDPGEQYDMLKLAPEMVEPIIERAKKFYAGIKPVKRCPPLEGKPGGA